MKIAILSDIHGNHLALKEVMGKIRNLKIKQLFVLGDIVGYYYHPDKVIKLLKSFRKEMILGNHDIMLKEAAEDKFKAKKIKEKYGSGISMALKSLDKQTIKELTSLPSVKTVEIDGIRFLICHGSPWNRDLYIYPDADQSTLRKCTNYGTDFVLMGHTHYPFVYKYDKATLVNAGSVGQARDAGGSASWALIDTSRKTVEIKRTPYETGKIICEVKKEDPDHPYLHEVLIRNSKETVKQKHVIRNKKA